MSKTMLSASWIADTTPTSMSEREIPGTSLTSIVATTAQTRRIWQCMLHARQSWVALSMRERVRRLAWVSVALRREGVGEDVARLADSTGLSVAGMRAAWEVTFAPWTESALLEMLQAEGLEGGATGKDALLLPQRLVHILAGNVLPPTWSLLVRGWLLGAGQWLRPSWREPLFASTVLRRVSKLDALLAAMTTVTWWPHAQHGLEPMAQDVLAHADVVTAHGEDATIAKVEASLHGLPGARHFVGYGSRWSCVVLGSNDLTQGTADAVAEDVALFDQQGCLSPTRVFVAADAPAEQWCGWLAQALAEQQRVMPRGEPGNRARASLRHYMECMRLAQAQGQVRRMWTPSSATDWSVVLSDFCEEWESPLDRHVLVHPVSGAAELQRALQTRLATVQGVGVRSTDSDDTWRQKILQTLHPTRVAPVGSLQLAAPAWCQDHRRPLRSLLLEAVNDS